MFRIIVACQSRKVLGITQNPAIEVLACIVIPSVLVSVVTPVCVCVCACVCVCVSVCLSVWTITFQVNSLWPRRLACWLTLTLSRSSLKVKVVGQSSRSQRLFVKFVMLNWPRVSAFLVSLSLFACAQNQYALRFDDPTWQRYISSLKPLVSHSCQLCEL